DRPPVPRECSPSSIRRAPAPPPHSTVPVPSRDGTGTEFAVLGGRRAPRGRWKILGGWGGVVAAGLVEQAVGRLLQAVHLAGIPAIGLLVDKVANAVNGTAELLGSALGHMGGLVLEFPDLVLDLVKKSQVTPPFAREAKHASV